MSRSIVFSAVIFLSSLFSARAVFAETEAPAPVSAQEQAASPAPAEASLYERLGGEQAIASVVEVFTAKAASDPKVNFTRQGTPKPWNATPEKVEVFKKHMTQFIAGVTGGPQVYEGKDMVTAHAGMKITHAEFDALAADLKAALQEFNVPQKEQDELLALVETTRGAIVEEA